MAFTDVLESTGWNNAIMKQIRKTLAATTLIMGSAAVAMILFGNERDGGSLVGGATLVVRNIMSRIGGMDPIIAGVGVTLVLMVGIAFWVRGK